jgi:hypothetical protein
MIPVDMASVACSVTLYQFPGHYTTMAFVRKRAASTALVEAYRDDKGRPRQRILANLHGEATALEALAKLAALRASLREELEPLVKEKVEANQFYEIVTTNTLQGHRYSVDERKEIDGLMRQRKRLLQRITKIERDLDIIQRDGAIIKKYCSATPDEIQAAIQAFKQKHQEAEYLILGMEFALKQQIKEAKAKLRRLNGV